MEFPDLNTVNDNIMLDLKNCEQRKYERYISLREIILDVLSDKSNVTCSEISDLEKQLETISSTIDDIENKISLNLFVKEGSRLLSKYNDVLKQNKVSFFRRRKGVESSRDTREKVREILVEYIEFVSTLTNLVNVVPYIEKISESLGPHPSSVEPRPAECCSVQGTITYNDRLVVCGNCGSQVNEILESKSSFIDTERINNSSKYKYNREVHIIDCIKQYQGRENVAIPDDIIDKIRHQLQINGKQNLDAVYPQDIRSALSVQGLSQYYKNIVSIWSRITNKECPDISWLEDRLMEDFELVEREYSRLVINNPKEDRSSFMSYPYVLYQLLRRYCDDVDKRFFNMLEVDRIQWLDDVMEKIYVSLEWPNFKPLGR